jgi:hypothetical protein
MSNYIDQYAPDLEWGAAPMLLSRPGEDPVTFVWREYRNEVETVFQRVWLLEATPKEALAEAGARLQVSWDRARQRREIPPSPLLDIGPQQVVGRIFAGAYPASRVREVN